MFRINLPMVCFQAMSKIEKLTEAQTKAILPQLIELLQDSVQSGASVGYLSPLSADTATKFWLKTFREMREGKRILLVVSESENVAGAVQLALAAKENGLHRAEVQKLLVHTRFRRRGIARSLMRAIEDVALQMGRTLLVLDTLQGSAAEKLYAVCGYTKAGLIPQYARGADEHLHGTVLFYRLLGDAE